MKKLLDDIIKSENIRTVFQPIVSLVDGTILGYEALSRGPEGSPLERPDMLFKVAEANNMIWELEYLCRVKALEKAQKMVPIKMLFLNVDPKVMNDEKFKSGFTKDFILKLGIDPANIIFEITERTCIEDYKIFKKTIDNYIDQGFRIAIDDTGAGYSGLKMLAEVHPHYIKLDMDLIRDIDKKALNQALVKALAEFAISVNMKTIAEGIETIDELNVLIGFGIHYGQGYLLQRPSPGFLEITASNKNLILNKQAQMRKQYLQTSSSISIGEIARFDTPVNSSATGNVINEVFSGCVSVQGIPIVNNGAPVGLIMRSEFYAHLATQFGVAVFMNRPIQLLMNNSPLIVDYHTSIAQVSKTAISRREENLYDYIIITKDGQYYGITTVKNLLEEITRVELNSAKHSNPLTGLPGNPIIEEKIRNIFDSKEAAYVMYFDLDNFKSYNDIYGFENGDKIIALTAHIIQECLSSSSSQENFLGHIGGDDFVAVTYTDDIRKLCDDIMQVFDNKVKNYYTETDKSNGYIIAKNRHGVEERFPIISISIAVVNNANNNFKVSEELSAKLSTLKKKCKLQCYSCCCIE